MKKQREPESEEEVRLKRAIEERLPDMDEIFENIGLKSAELAQNQEK